MEIPSKFPLEFLNKFWEESLENSWQKRIAGQSRIAYFEKIWENSGSSSWMNPKENLWKVLEIIPGEIFKTIRGETYSAIPGVADEKF